MRTIRYRLEDLKKVTIHIGYVGENEHTRVNIDAGEVFAENPNAVVTMKVQPPRGEVYPVTVSQEGDIVTWDVKDSDLVSRGAGEIQLTFTEGTEVIKSCIARISIDRSIVGNGTAPDPVQDWVDSANEKLAAVEEATTDAETAAGKIDDMTVAASGSAYGSEPTATITEVEGHKHIALTIPAGQPGTPGDPTQLIDDTAGAGTTGKTWSADKIQGVTSQLSTDITKDEADTKNNFGNIVNIVEGIGYLNVNIIENKYAKYSAKTLGTLNGVNVAEFDVSNVIKFIYRYTIETPDARGLYFVDKNGTALETSYQTLATQQDITVPDGAVKCYATVTDFSYDIFVYEIVAEKPKEILRDQATYTSRTHGGITYDWQNNNSKVYIHGKRTGTSIDTLYNNATGFPTGMKAGEKYRFVIKTQSNAIQLALLPYINGSEGSIVTITNERYYTIPNTWTGIAIRIMVFGNNVEVDETINCPEIYTIPATKSITDQINDLNDMAYGNADNPLAYVHNEAGLISLFHTVGCIGDSLASGECAYKTSGTTHYVDLYPFSWGQCLARLTGNTYYNFSQGGLSTRTWLSSQHATDCFDGNHDCDAYFIGLGQNDKNNSIPVGTTADINLSDYTQNADTYCGNMGKIIQKLQELQPKAPIFVFIDPNTPSDDQTYNNVIPDIVELFENVWIIDLKTYGQAMFTDKTSIIGSQYRGGHYSAVGYQQIAYVIATYVDWIIKHNLSDFSQVEFIGTNYEWTT